MGKIESTLEGFKNNLTKNHEKSVETAMERSMQKYEGVYKSFKKYFASANMEEIIQNKAGIKEIAYLDDIKATKSELFQARALIDSLNERVKHLSNLQSEMASSLIPLRTQLMSYDETTKQQILQKIENISNQSAIVSSWINNCQLDE